ncbi:collagen binding domain-containing protein [Paludicola sp. MB14-C6]|uniref:collagen binding domain-containing protein n=1 Tax=Paludihabitans sp. MB14-C6 TaxID=3070656 RepID=UPI0027DBBC28|nr:collagen binding domain-containing protein [Paludicola sp. MB14-C6]WMJ22981.1 collagen binding domain-containing protein [Paludicola sp. MB14-C6]
MLNKKRNRKNQMQFFSVLIAFTLFISGILQSGVGSIVFADEPSGFSIAQAQISLNDVPIDEITQPIKQDANVKLEYTWNIENNYDPQPGEKISVALPDALDYGTETVTGDLIDQNNEIYGKWNMIPSTKKLELELGTLPQERSNVHGTVQLNLNFKVNTMLVDVPYELNIPLSGGKVQTYVIHFEVPSNTAVKKSGVQSSIDANLINWTVDVNQNLQKVAVPIVKDQIEPLLVYQANSLKVYELAVKSDGSVVATSNPVDQSNYAVTYDTTTKLLTVTFQSPISRAYRLTYDTKIDPDKIDKSKTTFVYTNQVSFNGASDTATVNITRAPLIVKDGKLDQAFNANKITWSINVNKSLYSLTDSKVEDTIPNGLTLNTNSIKLYVMPNKMLVDSNSYSVNYDVDTKKLTIGLGDINKEYLIEYDTAVNESEKNNNATSISFTNNAKLLYGTNEDIKIATATKPITVSKGKTIVKTGTAKIGYNDEKYIEWTVDLNLSEINLGTPIYTDVIGLDHKFDTSYGIKVYPLTVNHSKTNGNITQGAELVGGECTKTFVGSDPVSEFNINFGSNIDKPYRIVYRTIITKKATQNFVNSGYIGLNDGTADVTTTVRPTIENIFAKANTSIDYSVKQLNWRITANPIKQSINNLVIEDAFTPGLTMTNAQLDALTVNKGTTSLVKDTDYTVVPTIVNGKIKGFKISFADKGYVLNDNVYTIVYATMMDSDVLSNNGNLNYANTATFKYDGGTLSKTATPTINNTALHNGNKSGILDVANKQINWTINTNHLSKNIEHFEVTDAIVENQTLVKNSIKIHRYTINSLGNIVVGDIVDPESSGFVIEEATDGTSFKIQYPNTINSPYQITYATKLVNISQTSYNNTAVTNKDENYTAKVDFADGDKFVSKTGTRVGTSYVNWAITLNKSQSTISSFKLTDKMSEGLELVANSFIVKKTDNTQVDFNSLFTLNVRPRTLATDPQIFDLIAKHQIAETYIIEYRTNLILDEILENKVFNDVSFEGEQVVSGVKQSTSIIKHTFVTGAGTGTGEVGSFKLKKVNENGNPLQGAKFEFYKGTKLLGVLTTDANGEAAVSRLRYANYTLKEIEAPTGYQFTNENINFTINNTQEKIISVTNDSLRTLEIVKIEKNLPTQLLKNAVFEVRDTKGVLLHTLTTDENGKASVKLPYGTYKIKEKTAPSGYVNDMQEYSITIAQGDKLEDNSTPKLVYTVMVENEKMIPVLDPKPDPKPDSQEVKTPEDTPTGGTVKVPEGGKPEVKVPPTNGTVTIDNNGKWVYTPNKNFTGKDKFTITINHPNGSSENIIVEIEVEKVPLSPVVPTQLPQTGQGIPWVTTILGLAIVICGIYLIFIKKRSKSMTKMTHKEK